MKNVLLTPASEEQTITISRQEYERLLDAKKSYDWLMEQLRLAKRGRFGSSSEKASEEVSGQLSFLFNEAEVIIGEEEEGTARQQTEQENVAPYHRKKKKNGGSAKEILPEDVETVETMHELPEEERICPNCGDVMQPIGKEVRETLELQRPKAILHRDVYITYGCQTCKEEAEATPVVKTPQEPALIPGSFASAAAVSFVATQKFVMYAPLYRQEMEWKRRNVMLSRQTMAGWLIRCSEEYLASVYEVLRRELLKHDLLHADETVLQVLHEEGKKAQSKSYMWLYRTGSDAGHPIVLYEYQPGRGQEYPRRFLEGFSGYLQTDGYGGYDGLPGVTRVGCWAHARRKFEEARQAAPTDSPSVAAAAGVAYCSRLFQLEEKFEGLPPEKRKQQRLKYSAPVLKELSAWMSARSAAPKSKLGNALTYLHNQWKDLQVFLEDGRIELSNNRAERSIKPFVMARKNFLFANTPKGAQGSAIYFSLIETARENGLDPYEYLVWALTEAPRRKQDDEDWAAGLTPEHAPDSCRVRR